MIETLKRIAMRVYDWIVYTLLCRKDYFTEQLSRMLIRHGVFFWGVFLAICVWLSNHVLSGAVWQRILAVLGLFVMAWLTDHLIDHVRNDPQYSDENFNKET